MDNNVFASLMTGPCEQRKLGGKYQLPQRSGMEEGSGKGGVEGGARGEGQQTEEVFRQREKEGPVQVLSYAARQLAAANQKAQDRRSSRAEISCSQCEYKAKSFLELNNHMEKEHRIENGQESSSEEEAVSDMAKTNPVEDSEEYSSEEEIVYKCNKCEFESKDMNQVTEHKKIKHVKSASLPLVLHGTGVFTHDTQEMLPQKTGSKFNHQKRKSHADSLRKKPKQKTLSQKALNNSFREKYLTGN